MLTPAGDARGSADPARNPELGAGSTVAGPQRFDLTGEAAVTRARSHSGAVDRSRSPSQSGSDCDERRCEWHPQGCPRCPVARSKVLFVPLEGKYLDGEGHLVTVNSGYFCMDHALYLRDRALQGDLLVQMAKQRRMHSRWDQLLHNSSCEVRWQQQSSVGDLSFGDIVRTPTSDGDAGV